MRLDFNGVKTALGMNISSGQMNNLQKVKYGNDWTYSNGSWTQNSKAYGYDSSKGLWYDKNGNYLYNAAGSQNWRGGLTWVGETGPELVDLPQGSRIYNAQESRGMIGGNTYNITVANIEQLDELIRWFDGLQIRGRMA